MKNILFPILSVLLIGLTACKKEGCMDETANNYSVEAKKDNGTCTYDPVETFELPILTTKGITLLTDSTATSGGTIASDGGAEITSHGICWSTESAPTTADFKVENTGGSLNYNEKMTDLEENTTYYVRAFAINSVGTAYGQEIEFNTVDVVLAIVETIVPTFFTTTQITSGGNIISDGNGTIEERGICWSTSPMPTINNYKAFNDEITIGEYELRASTNIVSDETYYFRAYVITNEGISYGQEEVYTHPHIPIIGELYQGGIVCYVNSYNHGLICALSDQSYNAVWGCNILINTIFGSTVWGQDEVFSGASNTEAIMNECTTTGTAAELCWTNTYLGYDDWFLPSPDDFGQLRNNIWVVNDGITANGGSVINTANVYWTSHNDSAADAYSYYFGNGNASIQPKTTQNYVRAVRAF